MAAKIDTQAQKQRKQKVMLVVGGVLLLALGAIQGPKLWNQLNPSVATATPAPTAGAPTDGAAPAAPAATTGVVGDVSPVAATGPSALLAGVRVAVAGRPAAAEGQLWSFSRFEAKDPFEPHAGEALKPAASEPTLGDTQPQSADAKSKARSANEQAPAPAGSSTAPPPPTPTHATIAVNGKAEALEVKGAFPKAEKAFVLVGLTTAAAKIGVAGGSFTKAKTVTLALGKSLTLVNTTTGARYVLKLLYTGSAPEQVEGFVQGAK